MTRLVMCTRYKKELPGLATLPFPNAKGQELYETISQQAWDEWQAHQTMLINERQLNMIDPDARKFLQLEMDKFMSGEDYAKADGFVPKDDLAQS